MTSIQPLAAQTAVRFGDSSKLKKTLQAGTLALAVATTPAIADWTREDVLNSIAHRSANFAKTSPAADTDTVCKQSPSSKPESKGLDFLLTYGFLPIVSGFAGASLSTRSRRLRQLEKELRNRNFKIS